MKRTIRIINKAWRCLILIPLMGVLAGCATSDDGSALLRLSANSVAIGAEGGSRTITIATYPKGEEWSASASSEQDWFTIQEQDNSILVTVEPNTSAEERQGELHISSPKSHFTTRTLTVMQEAAEELNLATNAAERYDFDSEGGEYSFSVFTNGSWEISTEAAWISLAKDTVAGKATISTEPNTSEQSLQGVVNVTIGEGEQAQTIEIAVSQGTRAENPYYKLCGKWEITANKWYYSPNGSLNSLDYAPSPSQYYLIFDIEEGVYGESLVMRNFLYPGTALEVRYDKQSEGFIIPFGWMVHTYNMFLYITMVSSTQFSYAMLEVEVIPSADCTALTPQMPSVSGFNHIGFGLWTYNDNGGKVAVGSSARPTMFPMDNIVFRKYQD
jgi:hypothetical protein